MKSTATAIWMIAQSTVEGFEFVHFTKGELVRHLKHGCTRQLEWELAIGTPEPWEEEAFWPPSEMETVAGWDDEEEWKARVRECYRNRKFVIGEELPMVDSMRCTHAVTFHYMIP